MKKASLVLLVACALCGCEKLEVETADILGTWVEEHSDYPFYAPEGNVYWTFYVPEDSTLTLGMAWHRSAITMLQRETSVRRNRISLVVTRVRITSILTVTGPMILGQYI